MRGAFDAISALVIYLVTVRVHLGGAAATAVAGSQLGRAGSLQARGDSITAATRLVVNVSVVDIGDEPVNNRPLKGDQTTIVSSWVLFHLIGNHTGALRASSLPSFAGGLRDALADSLEVCRSSVGIVDIRAVNVDIQDPWASTGHRRPRPHTSFVQRMAGLIRRDHVEAHAKRLTVTQMRAVYEVREFAEMRLHIPEAARKIDSLQLFSHFAELSRLLDRSLLLADLGISQGAMLDDVGYASLRQMWREPLPIAEREACAEEMLLRDARQVHQYFVVLSMILLLCIICAGSAVFALKHQMVVPNRLNPLQDSQ